jgi:hypothetical protein
MVKLLLGTDTSGAAITIARMTGFGLQFQILRPFTLQMVELPKSPE